MVGLADAFTAAARSQPETALRRTRDTLAHVDAIGVSATSPRWAWPLAARTAHELGDDAALGDLIALLDSHQPGHLAPMLRAERDLARARLAAAPGNGDQAAAAFAAAITGLRERSTPLPPGPWPARPRPVPHPPRRSQRRLVGHRGSPRHRAPPALPAIASPRRRPRARTAPDSHVERLPLGGHHDGDRCRGEPLRRLVEGSSVRSGR
jgi:hypothetical protein